MVTEIIIYQLHQDKREQYWDAFINQSLPAMKRWNIDVTHYGFSLDNPLIFHLIRTFESLKHRDQILNEFYQSKDWQHGARQHIIDSIDNAKTTVYGDNLV